MALIQELLGLGGGQASVRNAYLCDARLELNRSDEAVEAVDDKPVSDLLPGHSRPTSTMI